MTHSRIRKAVIPVAGLGTRFLPITKSVPKEMLPVVDRPILHLVIQEALDSGIEHIVLVTGRYKHAIEDYFDNNIELNALLKKTGRLDDLAMLENIANIKFSSVRQKEALGLGHAVLCAKEVIGSEPFAVLLGDDVIRTTPAMKPGIGQLMQQYEETGIAQVGLMRVRDDEVSLYGAAEGKLGQGCEFSISRLVEKPKAGSVQTNHVVVGRYVLTPDIWPILDTQEAGFSGEIQLTDALSKLVAQKKLMGCCFKGQRIDSGNKLGYFELFLNEILDHQELKSGALALIREQLTKHGE